VALLTMGGVPAAYRTSAAPAALFGVAATLVADVGVVLSGV
jgi:hypothetical protein